MHRAWFALPLLLSVVVLARLAAAEPTPSTPFNPLLDDGDAPQDTATPFLVHRIDPGGDPPPVGDPALNAELREAQLIPFLDEGAPPPLTLPP